MRTIQAIIILPQTSIYSPSKIDRFIWSDEYQAHIWEGRPLPMEEYNAVARELFYLHRDRIEDYDLPPYVQLVEVVEEVISFKEKPVRRKSNLSERMKRIAVPKIPVESLAQ